MTYKILDDQPRAVWQAVWEGDVSGAYAAYVAITAPFPSMHDRAAGQLYLLAKGFFSARSALEIIVGDDEAMQEWPPEVVAGPDWAEITSYNKRLTVKVSVNGEKVRIVANWATPSPTHLAMICEAAEKAGVRLDTCPLAEFTAMIDEADGKRAIRKAQELAYHGQWNVEDGRVTARTYEPDKMHNVFYGFDS